ncbi:hypothetical protein [Rathayibacter tanaceti]|uniref:hypothetical protein n=1 Tax=Rathayibacter tanaceti TaxID=1671680 RepID=UPI001F3D0224|nr:hypothetical protein [Rathayibacter tanaceti]
MADGRGRDSEGEEEDEVESAESREDRRPHLPGDGAPGGAGLHERAEDGSDRARDQTRERGNPHAAEEAGDGEREHHYQAEHAREQEVGVHLRDRRGLELIADEEREEIRQVRDERRGGSGGERDEETAAETRRALLREGGRAGSGRGVRNGVWGGVGRHPATLRAHASRPAVGGLAAA